MIDNVYKAKSFGRGHTIKAVLTQSHICIEENQGLGTADPGTRQRITIKGTCQWLYDRPCRRLRICGFTPSCSVSPARQCHPNSMWLQEGAELFKPEGKTPSLTFQCQVHQSGLWGCCLGLSLRLQEERRCCSRSPPHLYHLNGKDFSNIPMERFGRICLPVSLTSFQSREGPRPGKMTYFKKDWVLICVWGVSYLVLPPFHFLNFLLFFALQVSMCFFYQGLKLSLCNC